MSYGSVNKTQQHLPICSNRTSILKPWSLAIQTVESQRTIRSYVWACRRAIGPSGTYLATGRLRRLICLIVVCSTWKRWGIIKALSMILHVLKLDHVDSVPLKMSGRNCLHHQKSFRKSLNKRTSLRWVFSPNDELKRDIQKSQGDRRPQFSSNPRRDLCIFTSVLYVLTLNWKEILHPSPHSTTIRLWLPILTDHRSQPSLCM